MTRISIGFDGMCADVSVLGLDDHLTTIARKWPVLAPLMDKLAAGSDEELTCAGSGIDAETFNAILADLRALRGARVEEHIGANCALEAVTAANLLADRCAPIVDAAFDILGFWSPRTLARVPEKVPESTLSHAVRIGDSEAVSLIIPYKGKRAILSFGGEPPVRTLSPELRRYLAQDVPRYFARETPALHLLVGTASTWSAAEPEDFRLLADVIQAAQDHGVQVLLDLGGLGSWRDAALADYFAVVAHADILGMNESELAAYYTRKTGEPSRGDDAAALCAMVAALARPGQKFLVHTPHFQIAYGFEEPIVEALRFAGKAAAYRAQVGAFPTAVQTAAADFPVSARGTEEIRAVPAGFQAAAGYQVEVRNPVGLGDTWTCTCALSFLGGVR